jgi:FHA domain-containing protein
MGVILEIREGPMAGKVIGLKTGETVTVGRAAGRAAFALPHDTFMSGVHFAVECGPNGCRVQDRKSSNGTFLNGARIQDAMLANGDEIKGGQTIFAVRIVADSRLASLMPPQEAVLPAASQQRPPAAEPVPASAPGQRPRAAEPAPSFNPESRRRAAEPAPPAARGKSEPKSEPLKGDPEPLAPARGLNAEPAPLQQRMRSEDLGEAADSRPMRDAAVEPPPAEGLPSKAEVPGKSASPVEEPPRFHAVPSLPRAGASPPNARANPPRGVEISPDAGFKPSRGGEPPADVAPYMAEKFAERPASRGAGSARGAGFSVMGWSFPAAPAEWLVQEGFGLQQSGHDGFPSSVAASEELLGGITLQQFVESQISMLRGYLRDPKIEPTMPPRVGGADESMAVDVRHSTKDGRELVYRRIYARSGSSVGVLTVTTLAADFPQVLQTLQPLLDGVAFRSTAGN